jgi:hypothetical protein
MTLEMKNGLISKLASVGYSSTAVNLTEKFSRLNVVFSMTCVLPKALC